MPLTGGDATHGYKQRATLDALGVRVVETKVSAANDNARDAKVRGLDTAEHKRGGVTNGAELLRLARAVGRTAEGNDRVRRGRGLRSDCRRRAGDPRPGGPRAGVGRGDAALRRLLRCPPLGRQKDRARVVRATMDRARPSRRRRSACSRGKPCQADIATDAFSSPPGMRGLGTEAVELGDERRRALETVSGYHLPTPALRSPREGDRKANRVSMNHSACAIASASDTLSMILRMDPVCPCTLACHVEPSWIALMRWPL